MPIKQNIKIPIGIYCYDEKGPCLYWSIDETKPNQANGYCSFLEKGDWETNNSTKKTLIDKDGNELSPSECSIGIGLLWDQVKECGVNEGDYE